MKLTYTSIASAEFAQAIEYARTMSLAAAARLNRETEHVEAFLKKNPLAGSPIAQGVRRMKVPNSSYNLIYRVTQDEIVVCAFVHDRRAPGYWMDRL